MTVQSDSGTGSSPEVLIVEDSPTQALLIRGLLEGHGYRCRHAETGERALEMLQEAAPDLLVTDIVLPGMDGVGLLQELRKLPELRRLPVVVTSSLDDMDVVVRSIEAGADDYVIKPVNEFLLTARLSALLEKKRLRDRERMYLEMVERQHERSEHLLHTVLPPQIAKRLADRPGTLADKLDEVTVLFSDIVGFTPFAARHSAEEVVTFLNTVFSRFDALAQQYGVEKIKTIGDAYMAVGGAPVQSPAQARSVARLALAMREEVVALAAETGEDLQIRLGMATGPASSARRRWNAAAARADPRVSRRPAGGNASSTPGAAQK